MYTTVQIYKKPFYTNFTYRKIYLDEAVKKIELVV